MIICRSVDELTQQLGSNRADIQSVGFVPTMGALHKGHISLLNCAKTETDFTVVSIFVNPTQFNDPEDYEKYPRNVENDLNLLETEGCDLVFLPSYEDIYPQGTADRHYDLGNLDRVMEGPSRPGHFNGVAMVVHRLLELVKPTDAFFGQKDFQQLAIIKYLVSSLSLPIVIHGCPILREPNGLAMSSRNERLSAAQRENASTIYETLKEAKERQTDFSSANELREFVINKINDNPYLQVEYFELVDASSLQEVDDIAHAKEAVGCVAVYAGNIRLIDNIQFYS